MKYLKLFEEDKFEDIQLDMKDILLDISDVGYEIEIIDRQFPSFRRKTIFHSSENFIVKEIKIFIEKSNSKYTPTEEFVETLIRLLDFAIDKGFGYSIHTYSNSEFMNSYSYDGLPSLTESSPIDYIRIIFQNHNII